MFFLELSCFFDDPADVGNLISGSSAFSRISEMCLDLVSGRRGRGSRDGEAGLDQE